MANPSFCHSATAARKIGPIEKRGDVVRGEILARRIAPFILRRCKEQVATELPPKTIVMRTSSSQSGGVGLNLTAADTVIHFDPWWNLAVENQATDRAHRLGQTKAVFVYKLVVAGSIEEKILALQERKAALAAGILAEDHEGTVKFGEDDIRALLAPLPEAKDSAPKKSSRA